MQELKVVLIGDSAVGKSSVTMRTVTGNFNSSIDATLGAAFFTKTVKLQSEELKLHIWDTAGQEKFRNITPMYYRGAQACIIMYSAIDRASFEEVDNWLNLFHENCQTVAPIFLVANKVDLEEERVVSRSEGQKKADQFNAYFYEVSAKTGQGVNELFCDIPKICLEQQVIEEHTHQVTLDQKNTKKGCC